MRAVWVNGGMKLRHFGCLRSAGVKLLTGRTTTCQRFEPARTPRAQHTGAVQMLGSGEYRMDWFDTDIQCLRFLINPHYNLMTYEAHTVKIEFLQSLQTQPGQKPRQPR